MTEPLLPEQLFSDVTENYKRITENIEKSAVISGRKPSDITFMAVTKTVSPQLINHALSLGIGLIGENKVQELLTKLEFLEPKTVQKHIIGHLQTNKVRKIMDSVSMIQSVDSLKLAREISRQAVQCGRTMDILLEVNIGSEEQKTGLSKELLFSTAQEVSVLPGVCLKGLMTVPPACSADNELRDYFKQTKALYEQMKAECKNCSIEVLSMGMSADYQMAIEEGATLVRVGSALFGARRY